MCGDTTEFRAPGGRAADDAPAVCVLTEAVSIEKTERRSSGHLRPEATIGWHTNATPGKSRSTKCAVDLVRVGHSAGYPP